MAEENTDELVISKDEIDKCIQEAIDLFLLGKQYSEKHVPHWINDICEDIIKKLVGLQKPYKYAANCMIMQKNATNFAVSHSSLLDTSAGADLMVSFPWPSKQIKSNVQCVVSVYAFALIPS